MMYSYPLQIICTVIWYDVFLFITNTTQGQKGLESYGNKGQLYIPQSSKTEPLPSDCLMSYSGSYTSAEMQSTYSTAPANWAD